MLLSCAGVSLFSFDQRFAGFVNLMLWFGLLTPVVYVIGLLLHKIVPRLWNTCIKRAFLYVFRAFVRCKLLRNTTDSEQEDINDREDISGSDGDNEHDVLLYPPN